MKHVLIFAKTPASITPYSEWLKETDVTPIVLTTTEYAAAYEESGVQVYAFANYESDIHVLPTAARILQEYAVVAIFARAESDILRAAGLRVRFGIRGQNSLSAEAFRDKFKMKQLLQGRVSLPEFRKITSRREALAFAGEFGFPVVIKPLSESGSSGVEIFNTLAELEMWDDLERPVLIESFVAGTMYHVDGLVIDGQTEFIQPARYIGGCLAFRDNAPLGSVLVSPASSEFKTLESATRAVLACLPTPENTAFHAEFWLTPSGHTIFCEIASRTGGAMISSLYHSVLGLNLDREWLNAEIGRPRSSHFRYRAGGWLTFQPQAGTLLKQPSGQPEYVAESRLNGVIGRKYNGGVKSGLFLSGYSVRGENEEAVAENLNSLAVWYNLETQWELTCNP